MFSAWLHWRIGGQVQLAARGRSFFLLSYISGIILVFLHVTT